MLPFNAALEIGTFKTAAALFRVAIALGTLALSAVCLAAQTSDWQHLMDRRAHAAPQARIVIIDVATGHMLASRNLRDASRTLAAPGSTLKPLVLYRLLVAGRWNPETRVACNRDLILAGHRLACSHPQAPPFDAREALTWSCNTFFAAMGTSLQRGELGELLRPTGLLGPTGLITPEATAIFFEPSTVADQQLALLGVSGIRVTPLELATAYRWLALDMASHPDSVATRTVAMGLRDSVTFGMAGEANTSNIPVAGKTGTAEGKGTSRTHGWFVGLAPAHQPRVVVAVYLPAGRGADAAKIVGALLAHAPLGN